MASWTMHLVIAKKILEKIEKENIEIKIKDQNSFLIGNIIPDLERWVVPDLDIFMKYTQSHFSKIKNDEFCIILEDFVQKFGNEIYTNSLLLGYFAHLITDKYLNDVLYEEVTVLNEKGEYIGIRLATGEIKDFDKIARKEIKHREYRQFDNELIAKIEKITYPIYTNELFEQIQEIEMLQLTKSDLEKIINEAKKRATKIDEETVYYEYIMFSKEILYKRIDEIVEYIINKIKEH